MNQYRKVLHNTAIATRSASTIEYMGHLYAKTNGPFTIQKARVFFNDSSLVPTHKALRIIPANMDELHRLEADKTLQIQYHPFGYKLLPDYSDWVTVETGEPIRRDLNQERECSCEMTVDMREPDPIYVLWPVMHPLPLNMNYELLFDAYLPNTDSYNRDFNPGLDPVPEPIIAGYLTSYDNRLNQSIPIRNVKVEYQSIRNNTLYTYTNEDGYFTLDFANSDPSIVIRLQNDKFVIREGESTNIKSFALDSVLYYENLNHEYIVDLPTNFYLDVYRGAEYYFYGDNDLLDCVPKYDTLGVSIDIHAIDTLGENLGCFYAGTYFSPYIKMWNNYKNNYTEASSIIFGGINHELGHASNYAFAGLYYMYNTQSVIKESFASFVGWYNVYQYYSPSNQYLADFLCWQGNQTWTNNIIDNYTPIYVDLYDSFNQHTQFTYLNDDPISNVPIPFIVSSALGPQTSQDVCDILATGIGIYYTADELSRFLAPYSIFLQ